MPEFIDVAMSRQSRADLVKSIAELCDRYPEWRFGQLVANVAGWADQELWDVEDEQLLQAACLQLEHLASSEGGSVSAHLQRADH